jgi:hypothetical protein
MSGTAATPGPWRFDHDWRRIPSIIGADGNQVASIEKDFTKDGWVKDLPEREANALLIASCPDMLAAHVENARILRFLVSELQGRIESGKLAALHGCLERSDAAISAATGAAK